MDSPTFSLYSFFNLLMDNQGGASSSILVSIIISKYYFKTSKTSRECKQVVNKCTISISFGCL
jgi:hypothetical protein